MRLRSLAQRRKPTKRLWVRGRRVSQASRSLWVTSVSGVSPFAEPALLDACVPQTNCTVGDLFHAAEKQCHRTRALPTLRRVPDSRSACGDQTLRVTFIEDPGARRLSRDHEYVNAVV